MSRVTKFCRSKFGEKVPEGEIDNFIKDGLIDDLQRQLDNYQLYMDRIEIRKASNELRRIWVLGNEFLQKTEPWAKFKNDPNASAGILQIALNLIRIYAILSEPYIPNVSQKIMNDLNCDNWEWPSNVKEALEILPPGHDFKVPDVLFNKITDADRDLMQERFSGNQK